MGFVPIATSDDLGTYLNDSTINVARAQQLIEFAQQRCELIVSPLPDAAVGVVLQVAARAYVSITAARQVQLGDADAAFGAAPGPVGGIYLMASEEKALRNMAGSGGAFSIDLLPADYVLPVFSYGADWDVPPT